MKIEAYKCEFCNFLAIEQKDYKEHYAECKVEFKKTQRREKLSQKIKTLADTVRLNLEHIQQLAPATNEFFKKHYDADLELNIYNLSFKHSDLGHQKNTTNKFSRVGWTGRVNFKNVKIIHPLGPDYPNSGSDIFRNSWHGGFFSGIHTGSGGGGDTLSYSCEIYLNDFPKLLTKYKKYLSLKPASESRLIEIYRLKGVVGEQLITENDKMKKLETHRQILEGLLKNNADMKTKLEDEITKSDEWKKAIQPSSDFDFDTDSFADLQSEFLPR
jgi:hypothetical protein